MAVADRTAQCAECAVAGDERSECGIGAFDHPGVAVVGELGGSAGDVVDDGPQRAGQLMVGARGEEGSEVLEVVATVDRGQQARGGEGPDPVRGVLGVAGQQ